jgi:hypothetical protein
MEKEAKQPEAPGKLPARPPFKAEDPCFAPIRILKQAFFMPIFNPPSIFA